VRGGRRSGRVAKRIVEIAHSHPVGPLAFSREDETTMRSLVTALGRPLLSSVVAPDGMVRRTEKLPHIPPTEQVEKTVQIESRADPFERVTSEPWWTALLRVASGIHARSEPPTKKESGPEVPALQEEK
jgi:hypothetical protein